MNLFAKYFLPNATDEAGTACPLPSAPFVGVMVTQSEIKRRALDVFDTAVLNRDCDYLQRVALLSETKKTVSATSVSFVCETSAAMQTIIEWCSSEYDDCIDNVNLQLACQGNPTAFQMASSQQEYAAAIGIDASRISRPIFLPSRTGNDGATSRSQITAILKIEGRAFAGMLDGLQAHITAKASVFQVQQVNLGEQIPARQRVRAYLAGLLAQCMSGQHLQPPIPSLEVTATAVPSGQLNPDLVDSLSKRVELLKRRIGLTGLYLPPALLKGVHQELKVAIKNADPIDIAATACILWEFGASPKGAGVNLKAMEKAIWNTPNQNDVTPIPVVAPLVVTPLSNKATVDEDELLTTAELSARIKYDKRTLTDTLKKRAMIENVHYIRPFGGRKILYKWAAVRTLMGMDKGSPE